MTDYKTVRIDTLDGLKHAEALKARGWTIVRNGMFSLTMRSPAKPKSK